MKDGSEKRAIVPALLPRVLLSCELAEFPVRSKLESRRGQLRQRKETLKLAKEQHECEVSLQAKREAEIEEAR